MVKSNTITTGRNSNLELLRILCIIIIIAHHYVVNSGVAELFDNNNVTFNMTFLQFVGFGGKMAINVFVLISAYFMCTQQVTWRRVLKLILEIYFYNIVVFFILFFAGYQNITKHDIFLLLFGFINSIGREFVGSFLVFYLMIPFLNIIVKNINNKQHAFFTFFLLSIFCFCYTFLSAVHSCGYVGWFIVLYFVASYIRLYPNKYFKNKYLALIAALSSLLIIWLSILLIDNLKLDTYYYTTCIDCQKIMAFLLAVSLFLLFNNIHIKQSKIINTLAASTFGVLLIHANSDAMRTWLWQDFLQVSAHYDSSWLPLHFIISVLGVYFVCVGIDYLRIRFLEKPCLNYLDKFSSLQKQCFIN